MARLLDAIRHSSFVRSLKRLRPFLPPLNFITVHYLYFISVSLLTSVIFYVSSTPRWSISYTDSLFLVISSMTEAGLNTVNLSVMNTFQQWLLWMHILAGSAIFVSISVLHIRKKAFEKKLGAMIEDQRRRRLQRQKTFEIGRPPRSRTMTFMSFGGRIPTSSSHQADVRAAESTPDLHSDLDIMGHVVSNPHSNPDQDEIQSNALNPTISNSNEEEYQSNIPNSANLVPDGAQQNNSEQPSNTLSSSGSTQIEGGTQKDPDNDAEVHDNIRFGSAPHPGTGDFTIHKRKHSGIFNFTGVGAAPVTSTAFRRPGQDALSQRISRTGEPAIEKSRTDEKWPDFLNNGTIGRNSQFHGLTQEEREQLGGVEYRAITLLSWVVPIYFILWQFLGALGLGAWMASHANSITRENGINPWWSGTFNAVSAFNNSGMSLLDANMIPFQKSIYPVITMGLLILAGNTGYPVFLRLILWTGYKLLLRAENPYWCEWRDTIRFALDHPRRVYTHLFPAAPTWWLVLSLIGLNGVDWIAFELLNIGNQALASIPWNYRAMDGLFQALAVRSGGFYIVPIPSLRIGVQLLYVIMMYISVYPVVITMRNSNVYEERSLGIYAAENPELEEEKKERGGVLRQLMRRLTMKVTPASEYSAYFVKQQVKGQLAHDLSWLVIAILLIVCIEVGNYDRDPITFAVFNVVFEVISAYGCVGITTGLPNEAYSFSGAWHKVSKLILCLVMLRGRHRGLPVAIDKAVLLPSTKLGHKEEEDRALQRGVSRDKRPPNDENIGMHIFKRGVEGAKL